MTLPRVVAYIVVGWLGAFWVFLGCDAAWRGSTTPAVFALTGSAALLAALAALLFRDVHTGRLPIRRGGL